MVIPFILLETCWLIQLDIKENTPRNPYMYATRELTAFFRNATLSPFYFLQNLILSLSVQITYFSYNHAQKFKYPPQ